MNRTLATLLNWLDERRAKLDYPEFDCRVARAAHGSWDLEVRHLKVWLYRDARCAWIAQGLDIGYAASAPTLEEAQQKFSRGLASTLVVNMEKFGTIDAVVRPAPPEVWLAWRRSLRAAQPAIPKHVVTEEDDVVPGLIAPKPRMEIAYYGCPA
jgi:hypothetical protein